jgi:hypothetical protein
MTKRSKRDPPHIHAPCIVYVPFLLLIKSTVLTFILVFSDLLTVKIVCCAITMLYVLSL